MENKIYVRYLKSVYNTQNYQYGREYGFTTRTKKFFKVVVDEQNYEVIKENKLVHSIDPFGDLENCDTYTVYKDKEEVTDKETIELIKLAIEAWDRIPEKHSISHRDPKTDEWIHGTPEYETEEPNINPKNSVTGWFLINLTPTKPKILERKRQH